MAMFGAKQNDLDTYEVRLPNGQVVRQQVPVGANDAQVRNAFAEAMKYQGINALQQQVIRPQNALADAQKYTGGMFGAKPKAELKAYRPSLSEKARYKLSDMLAGMGLERDHANRLSSRLTSFLNDWTPAGNVTGVVDADSELEAQLSMLPLPGPARQAVGQALKGIRAFHGSPHDFDRFDISKIGTGEGAQAYGHGLYFAENPDVAMAYKTTLERKHGKFSFEGKPLKGGADWYALEDQLNASGDWRTAKLMRQFPSTGQTADEFVKEQKNWYRNDPDMLAAVDQFANRAGVQLQPGRLYEVNINATPDDLLDWDAPLKAQGPSLIEGLREGYKKSFGVGDRYLDHEFRPDASINSAVGPGRMSAIMTENLKNAGIPGIKYLDQGSRGIGYGSRNFVIFDDKLINILNKR